MAAKKKTNKKKTNKKVVHERKSEKQNQFALLCETKEETDRCTQCIENALANCAKQLHYIHALYPTAGIEDTATREEIVIHLQAII